MPSDVWSHLTREHGRKCVMGLTIDEATLDAETARQLPQIEAALRPLLTGAERVVLDYGCGYGRFSGMLADLTGAMVNAYDPCAELIATGIKHHHVFYYDDNRPGWRNGHYDMIFAGMVMGAPGMDVGAVAEELVGLLSPGALMVVMDHMPERPEPGRWWNFRTPWFYRSLFERLGIELAECGRLHQLENEITIMAGRR